MKISYNWLKQFIKIDWQSEETAALLTDLGLEVEVVEKYQSVKGGLEGIVVGHVLTCVPHPDADRLKITTVDLGDGVPVQIVCGASNVAAGQKVKAKARVLADGDVDVGGHQRLAIQAHLHHAHIVGRHVEVRHLVHGQTGGVGVADQELRGHRLAGAGGFVKLELHATQRGLRSVWVFAGRRRATARRLDEARGHEQLAVAGLGNGAHEGIVVHANAGFDIGTAALRREFKDRRNR